jgi:NAD+ synthase/NAD+ synthase (glutamine-hydrolysing)
MKIALLQVNPTVGDLQGNRAIIMAALGEAAAAGADLAVTPELALVGYLPRDLLLSGGFIRKSREALESLARDAAALPPVLVGVPEPNHSDEGRPLFNSAALLCNGSVLQHFRKALLPTYDVFDEDRYFEPYQGTQILELNGVRLGISICEDVWNDRDFWHRRRYHQDPIEALA